MRLPLLSFLGAAAVLAACSSNPDDGTSTPQCSVTSVAITGAPAQLTVGGTATLGSTVTQQNCSNVTVTWNSDNTAALTVSNAGVVTAVAPGTATVTASYGGKSGTAQITVIPVAVAAVSVDPDSLLVPAGTTFQLAATAKSSDSTVLTGRTFTWLSDTPANATVSNAGLLTAVTGGTDLMISATTDGKTGQAHVFVVRPRLMYFWSTNATPPGAGTLDLNYSFASLTSTLAFSKTGTGQYTAGYVGMGRTNGETEALFASMYSGPEGGYCKVVSWGTEAASLRCFDITGALADSRWDFAVMGAGALTGRFGYAWVNDASPTAPYAPSRSYRYSSSNRAITVTKTATGAYTVRFAGQGRKTASDREVPMISGYGGSNGTCQLASWATTGADLDVNVRCFDAAGTAQDDNFTIAIVSEPRTGAKLAYVDADQPSSVTAYTPTNSAVRPTGTATVTRNNNGFYSVRFEGMTRTAGATESFQVVAVDAASRRCQIGGWGSDGTGTTVTVICVAPNAARTDTRFALVGLQ